MDAGITLRHWEPLRRGAVFLGLLALGACAHQTANPTAAQSVERRLFVEANESIIEYHVNQVQPDQLATDGLARLATVDPELKIQRSATEITIARGSETRRFDAPGASEIIDWSVLTAKMLDSARELSPAVAALTADQVDEIVIDGALAKLDPYSRYAPPTVARDRRASRDGFAGIGITLDIHETDVRIASVLPDTPAASAGLLAGDRIVTIDGVAVAGLTPDDIRSHLRGPAQSQVRMAVARTGLDAPLKVALQRATIVPESASLKEDGDIAWIKLSVFNQQTGEKIAGLLRQAHLDMADKLHGIVLDLRDNPGGLLDQSVEVASIFLPSGDVATTIGRVPQSIQHFVASDAKFSERLPMIVLVNGGSASASEIVSSALQDSGRAVVIGTSSYGKGTVQTVVRTSNDGELTVTWAQLITPRGYHLNTHGVVPTVCTSGIADVPSSVDALLAGKTGPTPASLTQSRVSLDDTGWKALRALCPAQRDKHNLDVEVARHLLDNPAIYDRILASLGPAPSRVATASR